MKKFLIVLCQLLSLACAAKFRVVPHDPAYLLRAPDSRETPFPDVLRAYNGFQPGHLFIDLRPLMELRIENAYYQAGSSRRGLDGFLGTEVARYEVDSAGLNLVAIEPMKNRPPGDPPVQALVASATSHFRYYRFYYEIFFGQEGGKMKGSVLLGANSMEDLEKLSEKLARPESVCNASSPNCAVFPEACSVSVEMKITVDGKPEIAVWGTLLSGIVGEPPKRLAMKRMYGGRLRSLIIAGNDAGALGLPLLPGDEIAVRF